MRHREKGDQGHCGVLYYRCNRATTVGGDWEYFKASLLELFAYGARKEELLGGK